MKKFFSSIILSALLLIQPTTHAGWFTDTLTDNPVAHWINNHPYTVGITCSLIMLIAYIKAPRIKRSFHNYKATHESLDTKLKRLLDNNRAVEYSGCLRITREYNVENGDYIFVVFNPNNHKKKYSIFKERPELSRLKGSIAFAMDNLTKKHS